MVAAAPTAGIAGASLAGRPVPLGRPGCAADNRPRFSKPSKRTRTFVRPAASSQPQQQPEEERREEEALARGIAVGSLFAEIMKGRPAVAPVEDEENEQPRAGGIIGAIVAAATLVRPLALMLGWLGL